MRAGNILEDAIGGIQDAAKDAIAAAGKGVMDATASAVTGMDEQERDVLVGKMMSGRTDFNDYLKMTMLMQNQGGVGGMMNSVASVPGLQKALGVEAGAGQSEETEAKLQDYSTIIGAMTPEQRENPGFYLFSENKDKNIAALAEASAQPEEKVTKFLGEFKTMRFIFTKLGAGKMQGKSKDQVAKEIEKELEKEDGKAKIP